MALEKPNTIVLEFEVDEVAHTVCASWKVGLKNVSHALDDWYVQLTREQARRLEPGQRVRLTLELLDSGRASAQELAE